MITSAQTEKSFELRGLSTDIKPTDDLIENGSVFFEIDTSNVFVFDKENKQWLPTTTRVMRGSILKGI